MIIRPITDTDLPAVLEVYRQSEDFLALGPNPHASLEMIAADRELSRKEGPRQGADTQGTPVGRAASQYCGLFAEDGTLQGIFDFVRSGYGGDPGCAYIELLMIAAPYRGHGLGERALRWLEEGLMDRGEDKPRISMLRAGVQANNPGAIRFWQRMGFAMSSETELLADGTVCYQLKKSLRDA